MGTCVSAAVHFQPDLHAVNIAVIAHLAQARGDVLNGGLLGHALGEAVGPHLHAESAGIVRQSDELLRQIDLLPAFRGVRGLELARRAVAQQAHLAVLESLFHLGAFGFGKRGLHSVFVAGAQFDRIESGGLQGPYDGFQIHVVEYVVGDGAEQHAPILTPEFDQFVKITRGFPGLPSARAPAACKARTAVRSASCARAARSGTGY